MKNALIPHGTDGNSQGNWFPWLKRQLENDRWKVWVPDLPQADKPNINRYNEHVFANKDWKFGRDSILIGHSSGAVAILGLLQELPDDEKVDTCILVGSFKDNLDWDALDGLFEKPFDFKKIKSKAGRFVFIHSDNDPYCPLEHARYLREKLDGELVIKKGQKHFNLEKGEEYKEFPFLLKVLNWKKTIGFAPDLVPLIKNGNKTLTYRVGDKYAFLKVGDKIDVRDSSNGEVFGEVEITETSSIPFVDLPIDRKGHEKYKSKDEQRATFKKYYKKEIRDDEKILVLGFRLTEQY